mmetsp:Transcript_24559/g.60335  ORF Transcript_24559/g.60335 Transcript_24559/m.60335 type:complete len:364 (+) Transcript_24559:162-1253(+)
MSSMAAEGIAELMKKGLARKMGSRNDQLRFALRLRATFDEIDADASGSLSPAELRAALSRMGVDLTMAEVEHYIRRYSCTGEVSVSEFEDLVRDLVPPHEQDAGGLVLQARLKAMFEAVDKDCNKGLDMVEIREGLAHFGIQITDAQLRRIFTLGDVNGDGVLDYEEFSALYSRHKRAAELTPYEEELIAQRWEQKDEVVKDGDLDCRPGQKVMIRRHLRDRRGYQRLRGIGLLVRPESSMGGRWYVKFPCAPEVFLSTGKRGIHELMYVRDDPAKAINMQEAGHNYSWDAVADERFMPESALLTMSVGDKYANVTSVTDYEVCMDEFRFRLILARLTADPTVTDPRQTDKEGKAQEKAQRKR